MGTEGDGRREGSNKKKPKGKEWIRWNVPSSTSLSTDSVEERHIRKGR